MMQLLRKTVWQFAKIKHKEHTTCYYSPRNLPKRNKNTYPHKKIYTKVNRIIVIIVQMWKQCKCPYDD